MFFKMVLFLFVISCSSPEIQSNEKRGKNIESNSNGGNGQNGNSGKPNSNNPSGVSTISNQPDIKNTPVTAKVSPIKSEPKPSPVPTNKMMLLDVNMAKNISEKDTPSDTVLSFKEMSDIGINAILIRQFNRKNYSHWEMVNEAHEHGFWVAGAPSLRHDNGVEGLQEDVGQWASLGVDFLQLDEPFEWSSCQSDTRIGYSLLEPQYKQVKKFGKKFKADLKIVITDVNCNSVLSGWSSLDGMFNEMYFDQWYSGYMPGVLNHKQNNPNQFVGNWVWLLSWGDPYLGQDTFVTNDQFSLWTSETYNKLGNVMLFIFNRRKAGQSLNDNGSDWDAKAKIVKQVTGGGSPYPEWSGFVQSATSGAFDAVVNVIDSRYGVDIDSLEVFVSEFEKSGNTKWVKFENFSVNAESGPKSKIEIKVNRIPSLQLGQGDQYNGPRIRVKFKEVDKKERLRNRRIITKDLPLKVDHIIFQKLESTSENVFAIALESIAGKSYLNPKSEYSLDGGKNWQTVNSKVISDGGVDKIITDKVPFVSDAPRTNRLRFTIEMGQENFNSQEYPVQVQSPPALVKKNLDQIDSGFKLKLDFSDPDGVIWGKHKSLLREETLTLLSFDGDALDRSGYGYNIKAGQGTSFSSNNLWSDQHAENEQSLCFSGDASFAEVGHVRLGVGMQFSLSGWFNAQNSAPFLSVGSPNERSSMTLSLIDNNLQFQSNDIIERSPVLIASKSANVKLNQWNYYTIVSQNQSLKLYVNGNLEAEYINSSEKSEKFEIYEIKPLRFGLRTMDIQSFRGCIDEFHLTSRAETQEEIAANFFSGSYRYSQDNGLTWNNWRNAKISPEQQQEGGQLEIDLPSHNSFVVEAVLKDKLGNIGLYRINIKDGKLID